MPKQKSHGGISKKIKVRVGGTTKIGRPGGNHNTGKKNAVANRRARKGSSLSNSDFKRIKDII